MATLEAGFNDTVDIGAELTVGVLKGDKGDRGEKGEPGPKGDKGDTGPMGPAGPQGIQGPKGDSGTADLTNYYTKAEVDKKLVMASGGAPVDLSDYAKKADVYDKTAADNTFATKEQLKNIQVSSGAGEKGSKGDAGPKGDTGASAYDIAKKNGFIGNEKEWLASLKGADGEPGKDGAAGPQGPIGPQGTQGIQGPKGDKGDTGPQGPQGSNGKSAYEIYKENVSEGGTVLSETAWLDSLKGKDGSSDVDAILKAKTTVFDNNSFFKAQGCDTTLSALDTLAKDYTQSKALLEDTQDSVTKLRADMDGKDNSLHTALVEYNTNNNLTGDPSLAATVSNLDSRVAGAITPQSLDYARDIGHNTLKASCIFDRAHIANPNSGVPYGYEVDDREYTGFRIGSSNAKTGMVFLAGKFNSGVYVSTYGYKDPLDTTEHWNTWARIDAGASMLHYKLQDIESRNGYRLWLAKDSVGLIASAYGAKNKGSYEGMGDYYGHKDEMSDYALKLELELALGSDPLLGYICFQIEKLKANTKRTIIKGQKLDWGTDKTCKVTNDAIKTNSLVYLVAPADTTEEQYKAIAKNEIICSAQEDGSVTLKSLTATTPASCTVNLVVI